ncbi:hypothetical protein ACUSIJ_28900 [Pseudochelatococcus sp. B33]
MVSNHESRISNGRAAELTGATLPCPVPMTYREGEGSQALDRVNLKTAWLLSYYDLRAHHPKGHGELRISRHTDLPVPERGA